MEISKHLRNSLIASFSAILIGVAIFGTHVSFGVAAPTQDPPTSAGVAPTFTGMDLTGPIVNSTNMGTVQNRAVNVGDTLNVQQNAFFQGDVTLQNTASVNAGYLFAKDTAWVKNLLIGPPTFGGPIGTIGSIYQSVIPFVVPIEARSGISNSIGNVAIADDLDVTGNIANPGTNPLVLNDDIVIGKGAVIGTGLRIGAIPNAGGYVQTGLAVLGNAYIGYDPNTNQTTTANLDVWGDIIRSQSTGGLSWPVTINDDLKVNSFADLRWGVKNDTPDGVASISDRPIQIVDDVYISGGILPGDTGSGTYRSTGELKVNGDTEIGNAPSPKSLKLSGNMNISGYIVNPNTVQVQSFPGPRLVCNQVCQYGSPGNGCDGETHYVCTMQSGGLGGLIDVPAPVKILNGLDVVNGSVSIKNPNYGSANLSLDGYLSVLGGAGVGGSMSVVGHLRAGSLGTYAKSDVVGTAWSMSPAQVTATCPTNYELLSCNLYIANSELNNLKLQGVYISQTNSFSPINCTGFVQNMTQQQRQFTVSSICFNPNS